ncbi:MAG: alpha/beta hydrolase fold domain-containing protein [Gammaproteobacteria bacterium]|nr:alpha/beta hydrolase fold domain-containing protein [Gammaproteobacteria bacterium]
MAIKLDLQVAELLQKIEESGIPPMHDMGYVQARNFYNSSSETGAGEPPQDVDIENIILETSFPLPARIYRSPELRKDPQPALIYFHGGGWCIGNIDSHDHVCRWLAKKSEAIVISVDYRLAPEHKFPAAVDDAYQATCWIFEHAIELGLDPARIAVGGDSAGGNLSAVVCLLARDEGKVKIHSQLLIYPATDMLMRFPSHVSNGDDYRLTRTLINWFVCGYLRNGEDMNDMRASPLMAESHANLPPALILTAGFDPLIDEGKAYADKLEEEGGEVEYLCYEGMIHGFIAMPGFINTALTALDDSATYLKKRFSS